MAIAPIAPYDLPPRGSWPSCRAPWLFDPARAALLVHDMQAYFLAPYCSDASPLRPLLHNVSALRRACAAAAVPVVFSAQPGEQSRVERGLLWDLWGPGMGAQPGLSGLSLAIEPAPNELTLYKRRYSAFHDTDLVGLLRERGRDQLLICGVYAHIGCLATATDGFMLGVQPFAIADALADLSLEDHSVALRQVARTCGVVTTTEDVLTALFAHGVRVVLGELIGADTAGRVEMDDDLSDHGLDSLRATQLLERVLPRHHGIGFEQLVAARSLRAIAALLPIESRRA